MRQLVQEGWQFFGELSIHLNDSLRHGQMKQKNVGILWLKFELRYRSRPVILTAQSSITPLATFKNDIKNVKLQPAL